MRAKKSLGQNFLKSRSALEKIVSAGQIEIGETILEIGPGQGALTSYLLHQGAKVIAIEKDIDMITDLRGNFQSEISSGQLELRHDDVMKLDMDDLPENYKVIANIPYYITGEILRKFLSAQHQPSHAVFLVQKEVADRIMTRDGKESILSISVKAYCKPTFITTVRAGSFVPSPKVDSAIIALENISKKFFEEGGVDEKHFFAVLHAGFAHKRKRLFSNLRDKFNFDEENLISATHLDKNIRAEDVQLKTWHEIAKFLV